MSPHLEACTLISSLFLWLQQLWQQIMLSRKLSVILLSTSGYSVDKYAHLVCEKQIN